MKAHELKVTEDNWGKYLKDESWSIRNNDRGFEIEDICKFYLVKDEVTKQYEKIGMTSYGPIEILKQVTNILYAKDFPDGLQKGYCILNLKTLIIKEDKQ